MWHFNQIPHKYMNVFIIIITIIMLGFCDEFPCLVIAVLQRPVHSAKNTIQKTLTNFLARKWWTVKKMNIGTAEWAIGRFCPENCYQPLTTHISWMLVPGLVAGLHSMICGLWTHSLLFKGPGVFNRQRYGHKSLLSDKRKIKTFCHSKTVGSVKRLLLRTHSGMLSHTYQWPRTSSSLLIFFSFSVELSVLACACECLARFVAACVYLHICWPW